MSDNTPGSQTSPWILYIDDEINQCRMVGDFFTKRGIDVMFALSATQAAQILKTLTPSLIFLDLHMPQMNGKDFLHHLRDQHIQIPVIVITAYPEGIPELEEEAFEIKGFFTKPVRLEELFLKTKEILENKTV